MGQVFDWAPAMTLSAGMAAAHQAIADASALSAAQKSKQPASPRDAATAEDRVQSRVGAALAAHRRPILLALAGVVFVAGAASFFNAASGPGANPAPAQRSETLSRGAESKAVAVSPPPGRETPAQTESAAAAPSPKVAQPSAAPAQPAEPGPALVLPSAPKAGGKSAAGEGGVDLAPVGSINPGGASLQEIAAALKVLAMRGDAVAQYELGARYADGRGLPRDAKASAQWIEKAAEQGLAPAQYRMGSYFEKGVGVDRDFIRARAYYERAAKAGNARAMHNLAVLFAEGEEGKPDYAAASDWFRKAAEFGVRDSQYNLAILYARGLGVAQSLPQSYMWFALAALQGDQDAARKRDEVGGRLDSKELAFAKSLVENFKTRQPAPEANEVAPPKGGWESLRAQEAKPDARPVAPPAGKPKVSRL